MHSLLNLFFRFNLTAWFVWINFSLLSLPSYGVNSIASGNWSNGAIWNTGTPPTAGQPVIISTGHTVTVDVNTAVVGDITVQANATLQTINTGVSNLSYSGHLYVFGTLSNDGGIEQTSSTNKTFQLGPGATYIHNPRNVTALDETIFSKSNEIFANTSNLIIKKWFDLTIGLGQSNRVQEPATFGNVTIEITDTFPWEQNGMFMSSSGTKRIMGTLRVKNGIVRMDNGYNMTTYLELNDVYVESNGSIIFNSGDDRPLFLLMNNFYHTSTSANYTVLSDSCFGPVTWQVTGSCVIGGNFYGIRGSEKEPGASLTLNAATLTINGGDVRFIRRASAPCTISVAGNVDISGNPSAVRFIEGCNGNFNFSASNLQISGGMNNVFAGGTTGLPKFSGTININVSGTISVTGTSNTHFLISDSTTNKLTVTAGAINVASPGGLMVMANSRGPITVKTNGSFTITNGMFAGQIDPLSTGIDSIIVTTDFTFNSPTATSYFRGNYGAGNSVFRVLGNFYMINSGQGPGQGFSVSYNSSSNVSVFIGGNYNQTGGRFNGIYNDNPSVITGNYTSTVVGTFTMSNGTYRGYSNPVSANTASFTFNSNGAFVFSGGNFKGHQTTNTNNLTAVFNFGSTAQVNFSALADTFMFIGHAGVGAQVNLMRLAVNFASDFGIGGGSLNGRFISSISNGLETINISGNFTIAGGINSFNNYPNAVSVTPHKVILNVTGNMTVTNGSTYLSASNDTVLATVDGNFSIGPGELTVQAGNTYGSFKVKGGYSQSAGTFFLHRNTVIPAYESVVVDINYDNDPTGNFSATAGFINFDDNTDSQQNIMHIRSPLVTLGNVAFTMANVGNNPVAGLVYYSRIGTMNYNKLVAFTNATTGNPFRQVEQHVVTGCTLTLAAASNDFQIASYNFPGTNWLVVQNGAVLDLRDKKIISNATFPNSGLKIFGRLRTQHPNGLYNNTANAAISATGNMNYFLLTNSTIEYYGTVNQEVTGIGLGQAISSLHKYYNLEINLQGTPDITFAYPTNNPTNTSVFVRNNLYLTAGELRLDDDNDNTSGGRSIILENPSPAAITRTNGYIRSEVVDGSSSVIWRTNSVAGNYIIPFGYNSTNYIPFGFQLISGTVDTIRVATYHTNAANLPWPPTVTHLNNLAGLPNEMNTVDRFWYLKTSGTSPHLANLSFVATPSELSGIVNPRAQRWIPHFWEYGYQGSQSTIANGTLVTNATDFEDNWWTLASQLNPLNVQLLSFNASCKGKDVFISWVTSSEKNNSHFNLLKSLDGVEFNLIGRISGNGTTTQTINYSFIDRDVKKGVVFYKLIQVDYDGTENVYGPVSTKGCTGDLESDLFLLSSNSSISEFLFSGASEGNYVFRIFSTDGRLIFKKEVLCSEGTNLIRAETGNLSPALYFAEIFNREQRISKRFMLGVSR